MPGHQLFTYQALNQLQTSESYNSLFISRVLLELQKHLDLTSVLDCFFTLLQKELHITGLQYKLFSKKIKHTFGKLTIDILTLTLKLESENLGTVIISSDSELELSQKSALKFYINLLLYPIKNALTFQEIQLMAYEDPLTSTGNRRSLMQMLTSEIEYCKRHNSSLCLLMLDIDNFKYYNDLLGHTPGDNILQTTAQSIKQCLRESDNIFRYGGDEFCIILRNTNILGANLLAYRMKETTLKDFKQITHDIKTEKSIPLLSISIGITPFFPSDNLNSLVNRADKSLYHAKRKGKNCVNLPLLSSHIEIQ